MVQYLLRVEGSYPDQPNHIHPGHPRIRHPDDVDDDFLLVRLAQMQVSPFAQWQPADGFGGEEASGKHLNAVFLNNRQ